MSYQVLARKWRPKTFREMVGQEHVLQALINALDHNRLHHAYLFTGTRGVGKTTIARILAKCLNCETGVSSEPCGECSACREISEGRFVDLIEVDAASRTKVEDTRELLDNVQYAPTRGRYKIYLIDEVHMLSNHSFNALLKTLEEPPEHVKFLLATTDPQKLPVTILSRCLQFNLKNMSPERIVTHLKDVLTQELVPFDESGLWQLARSADGSMRDALSLTDQAIAFGGNKISEQDVSSMLGTIDQQLVRTLMNSLITRDGAAILDAVAKFAEQSPDYSAALADMQTLLHRIAIAQALPEALDNSYGDRKEVLDYAQRLASEDVQLYYQISLVGRRDLPLAANPRSGFEMTLLRMLAFKPQGVADIPKVPLPHSNEGVANPNNIAAQSQADQANASPVESEQLKKKLNNPLPAEHATREPNPETELPKVEHNNVLENADVPSVNSLDSVNHRDVKTNPPAAAESSVEKSHDLHNGVSKAQIRSQLKEQVKGIVGKEGLHAQQKTSTRVSNLKSSERLKHSDKISFDAFTPQSWVALYRQLDIKGIVQSTVANCVCVGKDEAKLYFVLDSNKASLFDSSHQQRITDILSDYFSRPVRVEINLGAIDENMQTPAVFLEREKEQALQSAIAKMQADPVVQTLVKDFGAKLDEASVVLTHE